MTYDHTANPVTELLVPAANLKQQARNNEIG